MDISPCIKIKKKKDKKKKKSQKGGGEGHFWERQKMVERSEREREREKRGVEREIFSLRSTEIGLAVFIGTRGKVDPRIESYAWVLKSWSFIKLHEVGYFPTWVISSLKAI